MQNNYKKNLLLIRLSSLGDVIFNIPLANCLKKAGYKVTWLVSEKGEAVIKNNPCVDDVILVPFEKWRNGKLTDNIKELFELRKYIKDKNFDIIIDTQGKWKSLLFTIFSGVKRRLIGTDSTELAFLGANEFVKVPARRDWSLNVVKKYLLYADYLGVDTSEIKMSLPSSNGEIEKKVKELLKNLDSAKPLLILCPVTTWKTKHWDKNNWKILADKLDDKFNIVFTGTKKDVEYIEYINSGKHLNLAGKTNLKELVALFRQSDLVISLDSGSTHLACASGVRKMISIYCSTPKEFYAPIGENYIALSGDLNCQPCHKTKCRLKNNNYNACTKLPSVETVIKAVDNLVK